MHRSYERMLPFQTAYTIVAMKPLKRVFIGIMLLRTLKVRRSLRRTCTLTIEGKTTRFHYKVPIKEWLEERTKANAW